MSNANRLYVNWLMVSLTLGLLAAFSAPMFGQSTPPASPLTRGTVEDWTHHRLVFSNPGTEQKALAHGAYSHWRKIVNDPRYALQYARRNSGAKTLDESSVGANFWGGPGAPRFGRHEPRRGGELPSLSGLKKDWDEGLLSGGQVQPNMYPAKYSFSTTTASCTNDFVVYPTGVAGATGAATIVAYNELYGTNTPTETGCGTASVTVPTVLWAYNTGGMATTSPVLSLDGKKVAFIQYDGTTTSLVVLKWKASDGTLTTPATDLTTSTDIFTCTAPCMVVTNLGTTADTYSSPYYDYQADDAIFVGDDNGNLYKITGVFNGPTTQQAANSPLALPDGTTYYVASPVYDSVSGCVFVGNSAGYAFSVSSGTPGSVCTGTSFANFGNSARLGRGDANDEGIFDAPLVDSTSEEVYFFVTDSAEQSSYEGPPDYPDVICNPGDNCVMEFAPSTFIDATFTPPDFIAPIGTGGPGYNLYDGDFDNVYYSSGGQAGNLWVMGNSGAAGGNLYAIPIVQEDPDFGDGWTLSAPITEITGLTNTTSGNYPWSSPITEYCKQASTATDCGWSSSSGSTTGGTDYIYFSVNDLKTTTGNCTTGSGHGCLLGYNVTNPSSFSTTPVGETLLTTVGTPGCWATGGIVIDNSVPSTTLAGAEQLYFLGLNGNTAGGPSLGGESSSGCGTVVDDLIPQAYQESQSAP